ncbi:dienelactone hydrolase family protein [Flavihumibacter sediminis]|nr:dienelactone hydrolase family protein [Flavihumibacter sediminis]
MRIAAVVLLLFLASCAETISKKAESYSAGFKTIHTVDKSRIYKKNTDTANYLHYRPIDIDMWYPADSSAADTVLLVHDLLRLLEDRANYYTASNAGNGLAAQLAQFFSEGFKCSDSTTLLRFKTTSLKNADAVNGKFPLIVYMTAYNGMSYENFTLFEALAKKGFIVLSISSIGRFPGDMTMKKEDLMEQVNDAVAALDLLKQNQNIDFNNIGIVGYSWGGLAGAVLASKIPNAKCLVSLEGSEFHHYGNAKSEDADFDSIINSKDFEDVHLAIPYLRLESAPAKQPDKIDSVYNFTAYHANNAQVFTIDSAQHQDFGCFSVIVRESGNCAINQSYHSALKLTVSFLQDHLKNDNSFSNTVNQEIN